VRICAISITLPISFPILSTRLDDVCNEIENALDPCQILPLIQFAQPFATLSLHISIYKIVSSTYGKSRGTCLSIPAL